MTIPAVTRSTAAAAPRRPAIAPASVAPSAPSVAVRAKAQAAPGTPGKFEDLASYKAYVSASEVTQLPAARAAVAAAQGELAQAQGALVAQQRAVGHAGLKASLDRAEQALEQATYPLRPQAAEKRAEAGRVSEEAGGLARQIAQYQQQIAQAEGRKAARSRDFWLGDQSDRTGWDDLFDGLGAIGDASSINAARKRINSLIEQKVGLEMKATTLIAEAAALHHQKADAGTVAAPKKARDDAKAAFDAAVAAEAPEQRGVDAAQAGLARSQGELSRLTALKADLTDYTKQFGLITRTQLKFSNWGWQKELDAFWKSKGL